MQIYGVLVVRAKIQALVIMLIWAGTSFAQDAAPNQQETLIRGASSLNSSGPAFIDSLGFRNSIDITTGTEKDIASVQIGSDSGSNTWNLALKIPVDKEDKVGRLATLDGLANSTNVEFSINRVLFDPNKHRASAVDIGESLRRCIKAARIRGYNESAYTEAQLRIKFFDQGQCDQLTSPSQALTDSNFHELPNQEQREAASEELETLRLNYLLDRWRVGTIPIVRLSAAYGNEDFEFFDSVSFEEIKDGETEWKLGISYTVVDISGRWSAGIGYRREVAYEAGKKATICPLDPGDDPVLVCATKSLGAPTKDEKDLATVSLNIRRDRYSISPLVTYDFDDDVVGIEVPIYLSRNNKGRLTGGVSFGWESEDDDFTAQVFIGAPFSLFN